MRPIETYRGDVTIFLSPKLACRYPDPDKATRYPYGRTVKEFPQIAVDSADPDSAACSAVVGSIPDTARADSVRPAMCELTLECGLCPRGLTPEAVRGLK